MQPDTQPEELAQSSPGHSRVVRATGITAGGFAWTVLTGDVAFALREIATGSVDCVVTSPPYY